MVWQQNRHQKVFSRRLYICVVGMTFWNLNKYDYFIVLHVWTWGGLELCFGRAKPTNPPPWWRDSVATLQLASYCNWLGKVLRLRDMSSSQDTPNFQFKHDRDQSTQRFQVVSILLHEAKSMLGLFCLQLNTIGRSGQVTRTIRRDNWLGFKCLWLGFRIRDFWSRFRVKF